MIVWRGPRDRSELCFKKTGLGFGAGDDYE